MRTGVRTGGLPLNNEFMPWKNFSLMTDDELKALWLYLRSLPPADPRMSLCRRLQPIGMTGTREPV